MGKYYIGIDLGATWIRVAIADKHGNILRKAKVPTPKKYPELITSILQTVNQVRRDITIKDVSSIGIGSIGPLDIREGIINPPNLPMKNINIVKPIIEEFQLPTYIVNDCTAAVLGEKIFGAGKECRNLVYITLSSGIGGGAIVDGNLLFGKDGNAVEIGHIVVDMEARLQCGCGGYGHWEAYASGVNIPNFAKLIIHEKGLEFFKNSILYKLTNGNLERLDAKLIYEAAKKGDALARLIVERVGEINAIGFANVINAYDPELITVGGTIALKNTELVIPLILKNLQKYATNRVPKIIITPLGDDIVLYGAIALAMHPKYLPSWLRKTKL